MGCEEFLAHWADYRASPWGEERADLRMAIQAALFYNAHRGPTDAIKSAVDFLPYRDRGDEPDEAAALRMLRGAAPQR